MTASTLVAHSALARPCGSGQEAFTKPWGVPDGRAYDEISDTRNPYPHGGEDGGRNQTC
jgi:hypothetical protein